MEQRFQYKYSVIIQVVCLLIVCNIIRCYKSVSPGLYPSLCSWVSMPLSCSAPIMRHRTKGLHFVECSMLALGISLVPVHTHCCCCCKANSIVSRQFAVDECALYGRVATGAWSMPRLVQTSFQACTTPTWHTHTPQTRTRKHTQIHTDTEKWFAGLLRVAVTIFQPAFFFAARLESF